MKKSRALAEEPKPEASKPWYSVVVAFFKKLFKGNSSDSSASKVAAEGSTSRASEPQVLQETHSERLASLKAFFHWNKKSVLDSVGLDVASPIIPSGLDKAPAHIPSAQPLPSSPSSPVSSAPAKPDAGPPVPPASSESSGSRPRSR